MYKRQALWRPNVKAAKDTEGLLKVNRVRSITGVGIKRKKNAKLFIMIIEGLLLKIPITIGGKLIAIPADKRLKSIKGVGIKRNKNAKIFIRILEVLLLKNPINNGGKLIAIPVDKRLKIIVSNISFKKSNNPKSELDLNRDLMELKFSKLLFKIK